jgi:hypothetical protein
LTQKTPGTYIEEFSEFRNDLDDQKIINKKQSLNNTNINNTLLDSDLKIYEKDINELQNAIDEDISNDKLLNKITELDSEDGDDINLVTYGNTNPSSQKNFDSIIEKTNINENEENQNQKEDLESQNNDKTEQSFNDKTESDNDNTNQSNIQNTSENKKKSNPWKKKKIQFNRDIDTKKGQLLAEKTGMKEIGEKSIKKFFKGFFGNQ